MAWLEREGGGGDVVCLSQQVSEAAAAAGGETKEAAAFSPSVSTFISPTVLKLHDEDIKLNSLFMHSFN